MGKNNNIIEINGKQYDARTGALLSATAKKPVAAKQQRLVNDIAPPAKSATIPAKKPVVRPDIVRTKPAQHLTPHAPHGTKTLMRRSVKKPSESLKRHVTAHGSTDLVAKQKLPSVIVNKSALQVDTGRLQKAQQVTKSQHISRFSKAPQVQQYQVPVTINPKLVAAPIVRKPQPKKSAQTTADLLERALNNATSHEQPAHVIPKRRGRSKLEFVAASVLTLAVIGVVGSQNMPKVQLYLASAKAGFSASLPGYQPAGYSLGKLDYNSGEVASKFTSNSNGSAYTVVQKRSDWDSTTLRDNFIIPTDSHYQSVEAGGKTIFLYGKHSASWVTGGIWYQIQTDGTLSDQQVIQIANSL